MARCTPQSAVSSSAPLPCSRARRRPEAFRSDLARFRDAQIDLGRALIRHLDDEEDLVIPLLLERGEQFVIGGA